jgi:aldehyde:ferredoxin oxidoreductase
VLEKTYSLAGRVLNVDLTNEKFSFSPTIKLARRYLGGRGVNWRLLYNEVGRGVKPLDPDNVLIYGTGLLVGTLAPCSCRYTVDSMNPFTGGVASSNSGGHFSSELKFAGYDHIVFYGRAERPVYLWIDDDRIEMKDASSLWGCTTWEADDLIKEDVGDDDIHVSVIGQAGENLVRGACIIADRARASGKCGLGAVMGSKNLKAVAVRGTGSIEVEDPEGFMEAVEDAWGRIKGSRAYERMASYGTLSAFLNISGSLNLVVKNFQDGYIDPSMLMKMGADVYRDNYQEKSLACFACPIHCSHFYRINEGPYTGLACEKLESNSISNFGANLYMDYAPAIVKAHSLCTEYGLDIDFASLTIAWAFECYQRGILTKEEVDNLDFEWGNHEVVMKLIRKIAYREGFGSVLAEGVKRASELVGKASEKYAVQIKGMGNREFMRTVKGWALGVTLALRGGGHTTGSNGIELTETPEEICEGVWGVPTASDPSAYDGKPELVVYFERLHAILDSLGLCIFIGNWNGYDLLGPEDLSKLVTTATGWKTTGKDLMLIGERIHNIGKAFNTIHTSLGREDDYPPDRLMKEPIKSGPHKGELLKHDEWSGMLDRYYALHGWNVETGLQTRKCLEKSGLKNITDDLEKMGKI